MENTIQKFNISDSIKGQCLLDELLDESKDFYVALYLSQNRDAIKKLNSETKKISPKLLSFLFILNHLKKHPENELFGRSNKTPYIFQLKYIGKNIFTLKKEFNQSLDNMQKGIEPFKPDKNLFISSKDLMLERIALGISKKEDFKDFL